MLNTETIVNEINTMPLSFILAAQKSTTDVAMCSHWEATQGISMDYTVTTFVAVLAHHACLRTQAFRKLSMKNIS